MCFICREEVHEKDHQHKYSCARKNKSSLSKDEVKYRQLCFEHNLDPGETGKLFQERYVEKKWSLPDFKQALGLSFKTTKFFLDWHDIETRTISESKCTERYQRKFHQTCREKYGEDITNPSQAEEVKEAKRQSFLEHYGVDNIFKVDGFREWVHEKMMEKYGKGSVPDLHGNADWWGWNSMSEEEKEQRSEYQAEKMRQWWADLSEEEKKYEIDKRIEGLKNSSKKLPSPSGLEFRLSDVFNDHGIEHDHQFWVNQKSYDFRIREYDWSCLIEVQGEYWHADPKDYEEDEEIEFGPNDVRQVSDIWRNDLEKLKNAAAYGYTVTYLWEREIRNSNDEELIGIAQERIREVVDGDGSGKKHHEGFGQLEAL